MSARIVTFLEFTQRRYAKSLKREIKDIFKIVGVYAKT